MRLHTRCLATLSVFSLLLLAAGCSSAPSKDETMAAGDLYKEIKANIDAGNYKTAVERLNTLQARFPFDAYGTQAQLDLIYANYLNNDDDAAEDAADRFIREHPRHPNVDYAFYMKGVAYFDTDVNFLQKWFRHDNFDRDPTGAEKSFEAFQTLLQRYPDSVYATDARQRMIFLRDRLAEFDWGVADWYVRRGAWVSALQRSYSILQHYPETPYTEDALQIMILCYKQLGLNELADNAEKTLATNFPGVPVGYTAKGPF
ncbi:MAG: outer membrane protein assembly factor BamD [Bacillota bacterium]